jgi:DNA-binding FadR family transcriptional regulator
MIAAQLRRRILAGEFTDGGILPKQDELLEEFGVGAASVREALRILETEGLVTVLRGSVGGAVVHVPHVEGAAYMLALVMQAHAVSLRDLSVALTRLDPACAAECAGRTDRKRTVVPRLRTVLDESRRVIDTPSEYMASARRFHEEIVNCCGNETMRLLVGTLETLWSGQVRALLRGTPVVSGGFEDISRRRKSLEDHEELVDMIAAGDVRRAEALARDHLGERRPARYPFSLDRPVEAGLVRDMSGNMNAYE